MSKVYALLRVCMHPPMSHALHQWICPHSCTCKNSPKVMHAFAPPQAAQRRAELDELELQDLTLKPRISKMAQAMRRDSSEGSFDRLNKRGTLSLQACHNVWPHAC